MSIVEDFHVIEQASFGLVSGSVAVVMNEFGLQQRKETLHRRIAIAIASAAHADFNVVCSQKLLIAAARLLATPIRIVHQLGAYRQSCARRHFQRRQGQILSHTIGHGPANDTPRVKVHNGRQIELPRPVPM